VCLLWAFFRRLEKEKVRAQSGPVQRRTMAAFRGRLISGAEVSLSMRNVRRSVGGGAPE